MAGPKQHMKTGLTVVYLRKTKENKTKTTHNKQKSPNNKNKQEITPNSNAQSF